MPHKTREARQAYQRKRYATLPEKQREARKKSSARWFAARTEEQRERRNARRRLANMTGEGREKVRAARLRLCYNLTVEEHDLMMQAQYGRCKICRQEAALGVDHCHETGRVRGLLCALCNHGLGSFKDSPERLRTALNYLEIS